MVRVARRARVTPTQAEGRAYAWACAITAIEASRTRRADLLVNLIVIVACAGVVAGYLICKLAG